MVIWRTKNRIHKIHKTANLQMRDKNMQSVRMERKRSVNSTLDKKKNNNKTTTQKNKKEQ